MGTSGDERQAWIEVSRRYPRQYSTDAGLSASQLAETDLFFRSANPDLDGARAIADPRRVHRGRQQHDHADIQR